MAYDELLADRARQILQKKSVPFEERNMMGGLCFMVDDKMCFGMHTDKATQKSLFMARVGPEAYEDSLKRPHAREMTFTGRSMRGYVFVSEEGIDKDEDLAFWVRKCLDYNPQAKSSKKKSAPSK